MKTIGQLVVLLLLLFIGLFSCKQDVAIAKPGIHTIYLTFKNGSIDECKLKGQTVYVAGLNANDAGAIIFDVEGKEIGNCNWAWGKPDTICRQLTDCDVVYRCQNHISGEPFVDKYGLSK